MASTIREGTARERAISVIANTLGVAHDAIVPDQTLEQLRIIDSLDEVELIMELEDAFGIEIDLAQAERLHGKQVEKYLDHVEELIRAKGL
jgi:acyl carrier protein